MGRETEVCLFQVITTQKKLLLFVKKVSRYFIRNLSNWQSHAETKCTPH